MLSFRDGLHIGFVDALLKYVVLDESYKYFMK